MAFPDTIVTFPTMQDVTASDGAKIAQYQVAIEAGDMVTAASILTTITDYNKKLITAAYLNSITTTCNSLETYYLERFSPAYIVSSSQPAHQDNGDFWFEVTGSA